VIFLLRTTLCWLNE